MINKCEPTDILSCIHWQAHTIQLISTPATTQQSMVSTCFWMDPSPKKCAQSYSTSVSYPPLYRHIYCCNLLCICWHVNWKLENNPWRRVAKMCSMRLRLFGQARLRRPELLTWFLVCNENKLEQQRIRDPTWQWAFFFASKTAWVKARGQ